jgi:hypothetical protein
MNRLQIGFKERSAPYRSRGKGVRSPRLRRPDVRVVIGRVTAVTACNPIICEAYLSGKLPFMRK